MAEEIKIPCRVYGNPQGDDNAYFDVLDNTNDEFCSAGLVCPDGLASELCFEMEAPVPADINATHNAKIRVYWTTVSSDTSNAIELDYLVSSRAPNSESDDQASGSFDTSGAQTDVGNGANVTNYLDLDISGITIAAGDLVKGQIKRDATAGNPTDALAADIQIKSVLFVADV